MEAWGGPGGSWGRPGRHFGTKMAQTEFGSENLGSLAGLGPPTGDQFGLTFGLKGRKTMEKGASRKHLEKGPCPEGAQPSYLKTLTHFQLILLGPGAP